MQKSIEVKSLRASLVSTQESEEHAHVPSTTAEESHPLLILLVEDNPLNQRVMEMTLAQLNCRTMIAKDGREAIQKLTQSPTDFFDLVLMDCQMPELDGYQTTAFIRQQLGMKDLPIIGSSASHLEEDRLRALASGMDDYLAKPIRKENLQQILKKWRRSQKENLLGQE
jgi:CheY-like chemotaxis protein